MDLRVFEKMDISQLRSYIQFFLWHYRVIDAFSSTYYVAHSIGMEVLSIGV